MYFFFFVEDIKLMSSDVYLIEDIFIWLKVSLFLGTITKYSQLLKLPNYDHCQVHLQSFFYLYSIMQEIHRSS